MYSTIPTEAIAVGPFSEAFSSGLLALSIYNRLHVGRYRTWKQVFKELYSPARFNIPYV
jgi:hypothetical protein